MLNFVVFSQYYSHVCRSSLSKTTLEKCRQKCLRSKLVTHWSDVRCGLGRQWMWIKCVLECVPEYELCVCSCVCYSGHQCGDSLTQICCFLRHRKSKTEEGMERGNRNQGCVHFLQSHFIICRQKQGSLDKRLIVREIKSSADVCCFCDVLFHLLVISLLFCDANSPKSGLFMWFVSVLWLWCICSKIQSALRLDWSLLCYFEDFGERRSRGPHVSHTHTHTHTPQCENKLSGLWKFSAEATQTEL